MTSIKRPEPVLGEWCDEKPTNEGLYLFYGLCYKGDTRPRFHLAKVWRVTSGTPGVGYITMVVMGGAMELEPGWRGWFSEWACETPPLCMHTKIWSSSDHTVIDGRMRTRTVNKCQDCGHVETERSR